jgi:alpha-beta hydrolase superfamily lysophospholipase
VAGFPGGDIAVPTGQGSVVPASGGESVALWLGSPERPLFSWLDLPADGVAAGVAVLCPAMGLESEYSSRALRDLAHRLATSRWAALRVDYAATGDSAGTWTDPDLVPEWLRGIRGAIEYARALGTPRVAVVGLRIGATLAAAELARGGPVDDLVLWDPCVTGRGFLREQRALWAFLRDQATEWGLLGEGEVWGSGTGATDGSTEGPGVVFSAETVSALEPLGMGPSDRSWASRELVLAREERKLNRALEERQSSLPNVDVVRVDGQDALLNVTAITPQPTLERVVAWLTESAGPAVHVEPPKQSPTEAHLPHGPAGVVERTVELGPLGLFGILSEPEGRVDPSVPTVVLLNPGRIGHHGPARLWVELARRWAAEGVPCLRVDLSGIGDSPTRPGRTELVEYPADALEDLGDIRRAVSTEGGGAPIFVGLCSGSYHAVEAALAGPTASLCLINPVLEYSRWGGHPYRTFEPDEGSAGLSDREAWGSTRPWMTRAMIRLAPLRKLTQRLPGSSRWFVKRLLMTASPARTLGQLDQAGIDVLVVTGEREDPLMRRGEERRFRALERKGRLKITTIPNLEHTLFERTGRDQAAEYVHAYVISRVADLGGPAHPGVGG